jgi:hypothetical protein
MANTFVQIGTTITVGSGGAPNAEFTSIPATYTDLKLVASLRADTAANWGLITINGGATAVSLLHLLNNNGSVISQAYSPARFFCNLNTHTASTFSSGELYIPNYAGDKNKSMSMDGSQESNVAGIGQHIAAFLWPSTAAITSITVTVDGGGNFVQYSTLTLYGIKST